MQTGHPRMLPRTWLLTDERQGEAIWSALRRLPAGSGIIVRHYSLSPPERKRFFDRIRAIAQTKGHLLLLSGSTQLARRWKADGLYGAGSRRTRLIKAAPAHDRKEIRAAQRAGADILLLSPLFATRSHPDAKLLGKMHFARLARSTRLPVLALGGVGPRQAALVRQLGAHGWAAIDAFVRAQD